MEKFKILIIIPISMFLIAIGILLHNYFSTGEFVKKDVELTGGLTIMIETKRKVDLPSLQKRLPNAYIRLASSGKGNTLIIQVEETGEDVKKNILNAVKEFVEFDESKVTVGKTEPVVGAIFWKQAKIALALAFIFMAIVVLLLFRSLAPSLAVILAAVSDIVITLAIMNLVGIHLSLATLAALLMLIGYSIDTDILLTTRLLKRYGEFKEKLKSAMRTGLTMTATSIAALLSIYLFSNNFILEQIALVLIIGLLIDLPNTWIQNACILKIWLERKSKG